MALVPLTCAEGLGGDYGPVHSPGIVIKNAWNRLVNVVIVAGNGNNTSGTSGTSGTYGTYGTSGTSGTSATDIRAHKPGTGLGFRVFVRPGRPVREVPDVPSAAGTSEDFESLVDVNKL